MVKLTGYEQAEFDRTSPTARCDGLVKRRFLCSFQPCLADPSASPAGPAAVVRTALQRGRIAQSIFPDGIRPDAHYADISSDLQRFTAYQAAFSEVLERFSLLSLLGRLQTFPVGISSLLAQTMPVKTPLGLAGCRTDHISPRHARAGIPVYRHWLDGGRFVLRLGIGHCLG